MKRRTPGTTKKRPSNYPTREEEVQPAKEKSTVEVFCVCN